MAELARLGELEPRYRSGEFVRRRAADDSRNLRCIARRDRGGTLALEQRMPAFECIEEMLAQRSILREGELAFAGLQCGECLARGAGLSRCGLAGFKGLLARPFQHSRYRSRSLSLVRLRSVQ